MIQFKDPYFILETKDLTYLFSIMPTKQLEHLYFGKKLVDENYKDLHL
jgi:alpha-galactosidase